MAGTQKHGGHFVRLVIPASGAGAANDTVFDTFVYRGFPAGQATANATLSTDLSSEVVAEAVLTTGAALTGAATNYAGIRLTHRNSAGTVQNQVRVDFSAAGVVTAAFVPINFGVASGGTVTGAGTGTLTVATGAALPWTLQNGDTITLDRLSAGTGLATPAISATLFVQAKGS